MTFDEPRTAAADEPELFARGIDRSHPIDAFWRAPNYISVGQIYLNDIQLLPRPLALADRKATAVAGVGYLSAGQSGPLAAAAS